MEKEFGKGLNVLVVENNQVDSKMLSGILSKSYFGPFNLQTADTLQTAFQILNNNNFDVVLLDLNLKDSAGLNTLQRLHEKYPDLPIVVNTGVYEDDLGLEAIKYGAQDYLIKGMYRPYGLIKALYYAVERKKSEKELQNAYSTVKETQGQLIQAEKMNVIGELASGVAHEVKNPLATIKYGIDFLKMTLENPNDKVALTLKSIEEAVEKANDIIKDLLDFSSLSTIHKSTEDINKVIESSLHLIVHHCDTHRIKITKELKADLPQLDIDRNRVEQVLVNVLMNSILVLKEGGEIVIKTYSKEFTQEDAAWLDRRGMNLRYGDPIVIVDVDDTGPGIPEENLHKIFDPFFTTRRGQGGVGLGLSIARTIMKNHNGYIEVDNHENGGARARLIFKVEDSSPIAS